ncbi:MAG: hypothetical protein KatS3mg105_0929 [Gemmatales bacterium]|nr:MAG: hypothetical protein KatS3mg105_0929 [Gemmatales bacterium]
MKRIVGICLSLAGLSGCVGYEQFYTSANCGGRCGVVGSPRAVPGVTGPWGTPVAMAAPYSSAGHISEQEAQKMMSASLPLNMVQPAGGPMPAAGQNPIVPAAASLPGGLPGAPMPPTLLPPGAIQPVGLPPAPGCSPPAGAVAAVGALTHGLPQQFHGRRTSVRFLSPAGMKISWYAPDETGKVGFTSTQLEAPGRYNFIQASIYRLKLSDIPGRPGLQLYPTLEVVPANMKTYPFLAHSSVPVSFTDEDFDQVAAGNYVVKVIYLPDPQFQDLAAIAPGEVVSSRLEPGVDPIAEAHRRGSILLIVRLGNIDLEAPNTPPMEAPDAYHHGMHAPSGRGGLLKQRAMGQAVSLPQRPVPPNAALMKQVPPPPPFPGQQTPQPMYKLPQQPAPPPSEPLRIPSNRPGRMPPGTRNPFQTRGNGESQNEAVTPVQFQAQTPAGLAGGSAVPIPTPDPNGMNSKKSSSPSKQKKSLWPW